MKYDDFAFSAGQSWELIQPLLVHLGYLIERGGLLKINVDKLANLQHADLGKNKFHISNTHHKGETKHYYVCLGKPHFSGPTKQIKATVNGLFSSTAIRYINSSDKRLRTKLQEHIDAIRNDIFRTTYYRKQGRIITIDTTPNITALSEAPIQLQPPLSTKTSDAIDSALALDLRIFPRPNRIDPTKFITLKKTSISNQGTKLIILITATKWGLIFLPSHIKIACESHELHALG